MILFLTFYGKRKGQGNLYRIASLAQKLKRFKQVVLYCNEKKQIKKSIKLSFDRIYDYKNITIKEILSNSNNKKKNIYNFCLIRENVINNFKKFKYQKPIKILFSFGSSYQVKQLNTTLRLIKNLNLKNYLIILPNKNRSNFKIVKIIDKEKIIFNPDDKQIKKIYKKFNIGFTSGGLQLSEMIANRILTFSYPKNNVEKLNCNYFYKKGLCYKLKNLKKFESKFKNIVYNSKNRRQIELNIIKNLNLNGLEETKNLLLKKIR